MPAFKFADPEFRTRLEASLLGLTPDRTEIDLSAVFTEIEATHSAVVIRFVGRLQDVGPMRTVRMYEDSIVWGYMEHMLNFIEAKLREANMLESEFFDLAVEIDPGDEKDEKDEKDDEDGPLDDEDEAPISA